MACSHPWEIRRLADQASGTVASPTDDVADSEALCPFTSDEALEPAEAPSSATVALTADARLFTVGVIDLSLAGVICVFDPAIASQTHLAILADQIALEILDGATRIWAYRADIGGSSIWPPEPPIFPVTGLGEF